MNILSKIIEIQKLRPNDGDILFVKVAKNTSYLDMDLLHNALKKEIKNDKVKVFITSFVEELKIIEGVSDIENRGSNITISSTS